MSSETEYPPLAHKDSELGKLAEGVARIGWVDVEVETSVSRDWVWGILPENEPIFFLGGDVKDITGGSYDDQFVYRFRSYELKGFVFSAGWGSRVAVLERL